MKLPFETFARNRSDVWSTRTLVSTRALFCMAMTVASGCSNSSPLICDGVPSDPSGCATDGPVVACTTDDECAPQVCDVAGTQTCVECTADKAAACTGTSPICGDDLACRGCSAHTECPDSNACLPDGSCAAPDDVAYVAAGQAGNCDKATPCGTLTEGVAKGRPFVKASGAINDATTVVISRAVTVLADSATSVNVTADNVPVLSVATSNADVAIYDLTVTGGTMNAGKGIDLPNGGTPKLALTRVKVDSNQGGGISSSGGSLTVSQSTLSGNQGGGISVTGNTTFDITNNFIFRNGDQDNGAFGGVNLGVAVAAGSRLEFNTIVDNRAAAGATRAGGTICDIAGFVAANNLIARNTVAGNANAVNSQTLGVCSYPTSKIQSDLAGLLFEESETSPFDYHVQAGSSVIDQATTSSAVLVDVDGDGRPAGAQKDIGADEL